MKEKLKSISISGFRIYEDPSDSTFDFTTDSGDTANFVVLYAPNGFGKTSLYDGLEWGITKSIQRFSRRDKENSILAKVQKSEIDSSDYNHLIRNRHVPDEIETFVEVLTTEGLERNELNFSRKAITDYKFVKYNTPPEKNPEFRKVLLSQEWISALITDIDGTVRFERFTSMPILKDFDIYYRNCLALITELNLEIDELKNEKGRLEKQVKKNETPEIIEGINNQINKVNILLKSDLKPLVFPLHKNQLVKIEEFISDKDLRLNHDLKNNKEIATFIQSHLYGSDITISLEKYYETNKERLKLDVNIKRNNFILESFSSLERLENSLTQEKSKLENHRKENIIVAYLIANFEDYRIYQKEIKAEDNHLESNNSEIIDAKNALEFNKSQKALKTKELEELNITNANLIKSISDVDMKEISYKEFLESMKQLKNEVQQLINGLADLDSKLKSAESFEKLVKINREKLSSRTQIVINEAFNESLQRLINDYNVNVSSLSDNAIALKSINARIIENKDLLEDLEKFTSQGLEIVQNEKSKSCPLCMHEYNSTEELLMKIRSNTLVSSIYQELVLRKSNLTNERDDFLKLMESIKSKIKLEFDEAAKKIQSDKKFIKAEKVDAEKQMKDLKLNLTNLESKKKEIDDLLNGSTFQIYKEKLESRLAEIETNKTEIKKLIQSYNAELKRINALVLNYEKNKSQFNSKKEKLEKSKLFIEFNEKVNFLYPNQQLSLEVLQQDSKDLASKTSNISVNIKSIETQIEELQKIISPHSLDSIKALLIRDKAERDKLNQSTMQYQGRLENLINLDDGDLDFHDAKEILTNKISNIEDQRTSSENIITQLRVLSALIENFDNLILSENSRLELEAIEVRLLPLEDKAYPYIKKEIDRVKDVLDHAIEDFFYEELINDIYNSIDPHPDFKEVRFKSSFQFDKPRLDILVSDNEGKEKIAPSLYFSQAQVNILSLSIFLANALHSEKYDCILLDDPVQSLDSINVLATIDLLRSLAITYNKQIILSTHDENFYALLKKKIPSSHFKSKFLKLQTFGKVVEDLN